MDFLWSCWGFLSFQYLIFVNKSGQMEMWLIAHPHVVNDFLVFFLHLQKCFIKTSTGSKIILIHGLNHLNFVGFNKYILKILWTVPSESPSATRQSSGASSNSNSYAFNIFRNLHWSRTTTYSAPSFPNVFKFIPTILKS